MEAPLKKEAEDQWDGWHNGISSLDDEDKSKKEWVHNQLDWMVSKKQIERLDTMSREEYISCYSTWSPYALVWYGTWYTRGEMGWFGCSYYEESNWSGQFKELWKDIPDTQMVTIVDCHI